MGGGGSVRWKEVRSPVALSGPTYDQKVTQTNVITVTPHYAFHACSALYGGE